MTDLIVIVNRLVKSNADLKEIAKNVDKVLTSIEIIENRQKQDRLNQDRLTISPVIEANQNCSKQIDGTREYIEKLSSRPTVDGMDLPMSFGITHEKLTDALSAAKDAVNSKIQGIDQNDVNELDLAMEILNRSNLHLTFTSIPYATDFAMLQQYQHEMADSQNPLAKWMRKSDQAIRADKTKIAAEKSAFLKEADLYIAQMKEVCRIIGKLRQKLPQ